MIDNAKQKKDNDGIARKYDILAEKIVRNYQLSYDIQKNQVEELLHSMIDEILN